MIFNLKAITIFKKPVDRPVRRMVGRLVRQMVGQLVGRASRPPYCAAKKAGETPAPPTIPPSASLVFQNFINVFILLFAALFIAGCQTQKPIIPNNFAPKPINTGAAAPSYKSLITRYNQNIKYFSRLWAHTEIELHWKDNKGKIHAENGTGVLIIVRPRKLVLTAGKLGHAGLWAGSNNKRYWMFNLRDSIAYTGLYKNINKPCTRPFPLPVTPQATDYLLGLIKFNPDNIPPKPAVIMQNGYAVVRPPQANVRLWINPRTAAPAQIDWLGKNGKPILIARLSNRYNVKIWGMPDSQLPELAHKIEIYAPNNYAKINLQLHDVSDGKEQNKIHSQVFDWSVLKEIHNPKKIINLDKNCK